ncbi:kinase-like domain-containing protein [Daldinia vernicosa]|uniref:kinase-like domain-containing protein n=1 Tax=Daldinia vernicosa TaxID=114800 RepID=UPI002007651E|nr:kinase-like domain-containing protein [Daldinia vernicosa]KAI0848092.1 kinase-like domain-containing protein [Daldinia vernicosa]
MIQHLKCHRIKERDLAFESHMSGFVYKVRVAGKTLIKKEIPGPDTVDEFLYEVNALNSLRFSRNVIEFYGVVVDDEDEMVKGLLINYAEKGALIDLIYDSQEDGNILPWSLREKWARQIVQGLSDVHEAGFVQGDLTLSNIVIDYEDNAKIIDINRRGCPVGWEPPEATPLIDSNQRISMYIGVKSDLYQLGMVLWALATLEDEPEAHRRPLRLTSEIDVPDWYRTMVEYCLHEDPRVRLQASVLLRLFPQPVYDENDDDYERHDLPSISVEDGDFLREYTVDGYEENGHPHIKPAQPRDVWPYTPFGGSTHVAPTNFSVEQYYPSRGRSPAARSLSSDRDVYSPPYMGQRETWSANFMGPYTDDLELGQEIAETPRVVQSPEEIIAKVQQDLEDEQAQATGSENQVVPTSVAGAGSALRIDCGNSEGASPLPDKCTATVTSGGAHTTGVLGAERNLEDPQLDSRGGVPGQPSVKQPEEPEGVCTAESLDYVQIEHAAQPPTDGDRETESLNHYTHNRGDVSTRSTTASPSRPAESPQDLPTDLTGVGSKYEHDEIRKLTLDDDLGLTTTATATATNVTS